MNLSKYEMAETSVLHLVDAGDEPMYADLPDGSGPDLTRPMRAHVFGPGSKQYARALNNRQNHNVDLLKRKGKTKETAEEAQRETANFLAACTDHLENVESESGATGRALHLEIYTNLKLSFIPTQIGVFINETSNFTKGSATS